MAFLGNCSGFCFPRKRMEYKVEAIYKCKYTCNPSNDREQNAPSSKVDTSSKCRIDSIASKNISLLKNPLNGGILPSTSSDESNCKADWHDAH